MLMKYRILIALTFLILTCANTLLAGGGWIKNAGSLYTKVGLTMLNTTKFHAPDGSLVTTAEFQTMSIQLYGEYGIIDRLSAVFNVPFFRRHAYVTASSVSGVGDIGVELKYGILTEEFPLAFGVGFEIPTGDQTAFGRNTTNPANIIFLPTGDGEFNIWTRLYASHSFYPSPAFVTVDAGYNFRTKGLTNQYQAGAQVGYKFFDAVWLFGNLRRFATAGTADPSLVFSAVGIGEGVEYTTYGFGLSYEFIPHFSVTFDFASAFGTAKNIYSGANLGFGIAVDL
jgi:hypothetical protein